MLKICKLNAIDKAMSFHPLTSDEIYLLTLSR